MRLSPPGFSDGDASQVDREDEENTDSCRFLAYQVEALHMEQESASIPKAFKYKLQPTPAQERVLAIVLERGRTRYKTALAQRKTWWDRGQGRSPTSNY